VVTREGNSILDVAYMVNQVTTDIHALVHPLHRSRTYRTKYVYKTISHSIKASLKSGRKESSIVKIDCVTFDGGL